MHRNQLQSRPAHRDFSSSVSSLNALKALSGCGGGGLVPSRKSLMESSPVCGPALSQSWKAPWTATSEAAACPAYQCKGGLAARLRCLCQWRVLGRLPQKGVPGRRVAGCDAAAGSRAAAQLRGPPACRPQHAHLARATPYAILQSIWQPALVNIADLLHCAVLLGSDFFGPEAG